jgi:alpha-L-arabinofuranosidase
MKPHSTEVVGLFANHVGDDRFYNNLFVKADLTPYNEPNHPVWMNGNVYFQAAKPSTQEKDALAQASANPRIKNIHQPDGLYLRMTLDPGWSGERTRKLVTSDLLGTSLVAKAPFEQTDGSPLRIDRDFFGQPRNEANPRPGPFETVNPGVVMMKIWP